MNREERALLVNISTILIKDTLVDNYNHQRQKYSIPSILDNGNDDDGLDFFISEMQKKKHNFKKRKLKLEIERNDNLVGENGMKKRITMLSLNFSEIYSKPKEDFEKTLHVTKDTYTKLIELLQKHFPNDNIKFKCNYISKTTLISLGLLKVLAKAETFHALTMPCKLSREVRTESLNNFFQTLSSHFDSFIKWPTTKAEQDEVIKDFQKTKYGMKFPKLFGILVSKKVTVTIRSQNKLMPLVFQLACDANGNITYFQITDANTYSFSKTKLGKFLNNSNNEFMPEDSYLIGDFGYPLHRRIITPFRNITNEKNHLFNSYLRHQLAIGTSVLKKIFQRFHYLSLVKAYDMNELQDIIKSISILHNLCQQHQDNCNLDGFYFNSEKIPLDDSQTDVEGVAKRQSLLDSIV